MTDDSDILSNQPLDDAFASALADDVLGEVPSVPEDFGDNAPVDYGDDAPEDYGDDNVSIDDVLHEVSGLDSTDSPAFSDAFATALHDHVVGDAVNPAAPAAVDYLERRAAAAAPVLVERAVSNKLRDWQVDSGAVWGPAGYRTTITLTPQCIFKAEKVIATDTGTNAGHGTRIESVTIGQKVQKPGNGSTLTAFFDPTSLGNGISFDTGKPFETIAVVVSFVESCTFDISLFGKAVTEE